MLLFRKSAQFFVVVFIIDFIVRRLWLHPDAALMATLVNDFRFAVIATVAYAVINISWLKKSGIQ